MEFRPNIFFELNLPPYKLRTVQNSEDLKAVLALRSQCFNASIDKAEFDLNADHLIVEDTEKKILCGTYRLTHSDFSQNFECDKEDFDISALLVKKGPKLELAWACIHPDYRNGSIVALLWRGISEIIKKHPTKYIFGITSVKENQANIAQIQKCLRGKELPFPVIPKKASSKNLTSYELPELLPLPPPAGHSSTSWRRLLPGLLRAYLMAGALVCAQPSYDADLNCYDFMTVIDVDQAADSLIHHYKL